MKIYTRTGDSGDTALFAGGRVPKHHLRVEAYGTIDELNAALGVARAERPSRQVAAWLESAQNQLFHLGADLATPLSAKSSHVTRMAQDDIAWLEASIDSMDAALPPLRNFILPGGSRCAAQLHVARTVCRRAERIIRRLVRRRRHWRRPAGLCQPTVRLAVYPGALREYAGGRKRDQMELAPVRMPEVGVEPTHPKVHEFESCASANSATPASGWAVYASAGALSICRRARA